MGKSTKEQIKNRMVKTAAELWGVKANEIETSFDPIISLLLSACSAEIEKISAELDESETRITEKLIELMTPEKSAGPNPAHAVLYAEPIDDATIINPEYHFTYRKEIPEQKTSVNYKDIPFTPIQDFKLINAKIEHLITGTNHIYFKEKRNRQVLGKNLNNAHLPNSTVFLGITSTLPKIPDIDDLSFYFEYQGTKSHDKEVFYLHLTNAKWSLNGVALDIVSGFYNSEKEQSLFVNNIFQGDSKKSDLVQREILDYYKRHYITVTASDNDSTDYSGYSELNSFLEDNNIKPDGRIHWIKIEFPTLVTNDILKDVFCSLNAFPVLNRELHTFSHRLKNFVHIIPLTTENLFFDVKSIVNTDGKYYSTGADITNSSKGSFIIRGDTMGSLEQRKAREYIVYLLELLKDESASFAFLNNDFLIKNLKSLNQLIASLEKSVGDSIIDKSQTHFAVLNPYNTNDQLLVEFWTSNGLLANNIKSGSDLNLSKGIGVKQTSAHLLTTSAGGRNELRMEDRLNSYRRALFTRDRIITKEDIRVLCYEIYGNQLEHVEIRKGFTKDQDLNKGWTPCIQILLTPKKKLRKDAWNLENSKLRFILEKKSLNVFPYDLKVLN